MRDLRERFKRLIKKLARVYLRLFSMIEGPELEPSLFHSHYLSARATESARKRARGCLRGDVLDVGAGTGSGLKFLAEGSQYYPTDIDSARDYRDTTISRKGVALAKVCSVYDIDYADNRFDACMALNLLEHLEDPDRAVAEMRRVVKPDGLVFLLVPFYFPVHGYPNDYWRWTPLGLRLWLQNRGIEPIDCFPCGKTVHAILLNLNLFLRNGIYCSGYYPTRLRLALFVLLRPLLTLLFFFNNIAGLMIGALDKSTHCPILVCAIGHNRKP